MVQAVMTPLLFFSIRGTQFTQKCGKSRREFLAVRPIPFFLGDGFGND
jgi:hypothetical protein